MIEKKASLHTEMFALDYRRQEMARSGRLAELEKSYGGDCPEVEVSTSEKWDDLANMSSVPDIRIRRLTRVADLAGQGTRILDIGPGWGDIIPILEKKYRDLDYTGIDFSPNVIKLLAEKHAGHRYICGRLEDIEEEQFDTILVLEVLEHIVPSQVLGFLRKVRELLTAKGQLLITIPIDENLEESTFVCGNCGQAMNKMGHVRIYSKELIMAELGLAGFTITHQELIYVGYYGLSGSLKRHMRNTLGKLIGPSDFKSAKSACLILKCEKGTV